MTEQNNTPAPQRGRTRRKVITVIALAVMAWGVWYFTRMSAGYPGEEAAWELKRTLKAKNLLSDCAQEGTTTLYASDQPEDFGSMAKHFLQEELTSPVLQVNIDRY